MFNKKLNNFIEGDLSGEMIVAMEKHKSECEFCNDLYNAEVSMDNNFKSAFNISEIVLESSRLNIIAAIDKNRYGKNNFRKLYYRAINNKIKILTIAAMFAICIFTVKLATTTNFSFSSKSSAINANKVAGVSDKMRIANSTASTSDVSDSTNSGSPEAPLNAKRSTVEMKPGKLTESKDSINFSFTKNELNSSFKPVLYSSWKNSQSKLYSACIEGKLQGDVDFGIVNICIKDLKSNKYTLLKIYTWENIDSSKFLDASDTVTSSLMKKSINNDYTPKFLQWVDNDRIMVVVGFAYGTVRKGGNIYLLNVRTGELSVVYKTGTVLEEVKSFDFKNGQLKMILNVFENEDLMDSHELERTVPYVITK